MSPNQNDPTEAQLTRAFDALDPSAAQADRIEKTMLRALDERPPSLIDEWLALLLARPVVNVGFLAAAAAVLLVATPVGTLASLLARALSGA